MPSTTAPRSRHLAAVWFADIVSYSRLASEHERAALQLVDLFEDTVRATTAQYGGRVVKFIGDAALAEFGSTEAAVQAALALREEFTSQSASISQPAALRIGVHVGDVVERPDGDLHGDGVNLASRIQVEAEPGQIVVSEDVWRHLRQHPEYRFQSVGERDLEGTNTRLEVFTVSSAEGVPFLIPPSSPTLPSPGPRRRWSSFAQSWSSAPVTRWVLIGAFLTALILLFAVLRQPLQSADPRDATYAVLPFVERTPDISEVLSGEQAQLLLHDALARWQDLKLVNVMRLNDVELRRGDRPRSLEDAIATARAADATVLVWGQVGKLGDSLQIRAGLYDVSGREEPLREYTLLSAENLGELRSKVDELARALLVGRPRSPSAESGVAGTRSLAAWKAYERGHAALDNWDLGAAEREFYVAAQLDPAYAQAHLWLAQVMSWAGTGKQRPDEWRAAATRANTRRGTLTVDDQIRSDAVHSLATERFPEACAHYNRLLAKDSSAFAGWYGLGECHRTDPIVIRDPQSPSGWAFRGSYHTAVHAYQKAFELFPSAHLAFRGAAFQRLQRLLFTEPNNYRAGVAAGSESPRFGAFPALRNDTLTFIPYTLDAIAISKPGTNPPTLAAAITRSRAILRRIAHSWTKAFPNSADAHEALAHALESSGVIVTRAGGIPSALDEVRRARSLATDPLQRLRLAHAEVRLLVKAADFAGAQALADSLLLSHRGAEMEEEVELLTGLAALTGRAHRLASLLRTFSNNYTARLPDGRPVQISPPLAESALTLMGYASLGAPLDSIRALKSRVGTQISTHIAPSDRASIRSALLNRPLSLAFPVIGFAAVRDVDPGSNVLLQMQRALADGNYVNLRADLAAQRGVRRQRLPGSISIDAVYHEAWLLLALGDTSAAVEHLDASLEALPTLSTSLLRELPEAASLARAMALRAELASHNHDDATARKWARAVATLWAGADGELQTVVDRMRNILSGVQRSGHLP